MKSIFYYIIKPFDKEYNNSIDVGDKKLITNTSIENFRHVSKKAIIVSTPMVSDTKINEGDIILTHHNVFRRHYDIKNKEKVSNTYFKDNMYIVEPELIYAYNDGSGWKANDNYCFVMPLLNEDKFSTDKEVKQIGILKYGNKTLSELNINENDIVGYTPNSEFEFLIDEDRLYCMKSNDIVIKYERKGNETGYNPVWRKGN